MLAAGIVDTEALGQLLDETWQVKRRLGPGVSTPAIDEWYRRARAAGALGGKLCGAGGGGCLLLVVPEACRSAVRAALSGLAELRLGYAGRGSEALGDGALSPLPLA
jgi:D-glycero-alpha-D-manno-heptose-7-phosphate kinase